MPPSPEQIELEKAQSLIKLLNEELDKGCMNCQSWRSIRLAKYWIESHLAHLQQKSQESEDTLEQQLFYLKRYEASIFIREQYSNGKWGAIALKDLTPAQWTKHVSRFLREGIEPCRILEPNEIKNTTEL